MLGQKWALPLVATPDGLLDGLTTQITSAGSVPGYDSRLMTRFVHIRIATLDQMALVSEVPHRKGRDQV
jgi:hypothetical protein